MNDNELDDLIRLTQPKPEFPSSFRPEVWARVSHAEQSSLTARFRRWNEALFQAIAQPAPAVAVVATMLLVGAGLGQFVSREDESGGSRLAYVISINPVAAAHHTNQE